MPAKPDRDQPAPVTRIEEILQKTTDTLVERQLLSTGGGWALYPGDSEAGILASGLANIWLQRFHVERYQKQITRGLNFLVERQHRKRTGYRGWGEGEKPSDPISTALATYAFVRYLRWVQDHPKGAAVNSSYIEAATTGLEWLHNHVLTTWKSGPLGAYSVYWTCIALKESQEVRRLIIPEIKYEALPFAFSVVEQKRHRGGGWGELLGALPYSAPARTAPICCCAIPRTLGHRWKRRKLA
jgi:hypothetical protein